MGNGAGGTTTTLGRIGTGFIYADWNGQIAYTTPNMNGLSLTLGVMQPWNSTGFCMLLFQKVLSGSTDQFGFQGQGSYSWTGDFAGKVWAGFFSQEVTGGADEDRAQAFEVGVSTSIYNINLVAYGYSGEGVGTTALLRDGFELKW